MNLTICHPADTTRINPELTQYPEFTRRLLDALKYLPEPHKATIIEWEQTRSEAQNALQHIWYREISKKYFEHYGDYHSDKAWNEYFRQRFLLVDSDFIGDRSVPIYQSTTKLPVSQMSEYLNNIDMVCADEFEIMLSRPSEYYKAHKEGE